MQGGVKEAACHEKYKHQSHDNCDVVVFCKHSNGTGYKNNCRNGKKYGKLASVMMHDMTFELWYNDISGCPTCVVLIHSDI